MEKYPNLFKEIDDYLLSRLSEKSRKELRSFFLPDQLSVNLILPVHDIIGSIPYVKRENSSYDFENFITYLDSTSCSLAKFIPENYPTDMFLEYRLGNSQVFSWKSDFHFPYGKNSSLSGKILERHIIYNFPRILLIDKHSPDRITEHSKLDALILKCDKKDGFVFAGQSFTLDPDFGLQSYFFGKEERNHEIIRPQALLNTVQKMLDPNAIHNQESSHLH